jgi:hypothetical protein
MALLVPPPPTTPPRIVTAQGDRGPDWFRLRLTQVLATLVTLLLTAWACTLGAIPAIIALAIAKHVLVAILLMSSGIHSPRVNNP